MHAIADCAAIISLSENVPPSLSSSRFQNRYELNAPLQYYLPLRLPFHDCLIYMAFSPYMYLLSYWSGIGLTYHFLMLSTFFYLPSGTLSTADDEHRART